ncbi:hypothetical protein ACCO45_005346 [Purpureocillium lilacinum]|uniref:Uncharacterized protein n=1 Tax=Purpureocillium lilacinum TaxID=33203 RepID=A0ACC4DV94_PURLI
MKFLKVGRVAIITRGRYAGKKTLCPPARRRHRFAALKDPWDDHDTTLDRGRGKTRITGAVASLAWAVWHGVHVGIARGERESSNERNLELGILTEHFTGCDHPACRQRQQASPVRPRRRRRHRALPSKITRRMSKTRQEKRSKIKPFIKVINYNHLMPTRYTLELEGLKGTISGETFKEVSQREDAKKTVKKVLEERYTSGKNRWFFTP